MTGTSSTTISDALEQIVARCERLVREVGLRHGLLAADIDEVFQEVRIRLWHARADSEKITELPSLYVYRTAESAARDVLRRRRRAAERSEELELVPPRQTIARDDPAVDIERAELVAAVGRAIDQLSADRRVAVRMHLSGYSREEIADTMSWSEGRTRNLLYRGLDDLRARLAAAGITVESGS